MKQRTIRILLSSLVAATVLFGQTVNDEIGRSRQNAITRTVDMVSAAVVGINVIEVREYRDPFANFFGNDPFFNQFFGSRNYKQEVKGLGSGFIISPDGYVLTNDHVAGNAKQITVTLTNGKKYQAAIIGTDLVTDICLLKLTPEKGETFPYVKLGNSDDVYIGEWVIALGNPFGLFDNIDKPIVTVGVVSAKGMNLNVESNRSYRGLIQTDAVINSGNSGGPLVNSVGEVIGINTLIYTGGVSQAYIGYGFALPINRVKSIVEELQQKGKVERNFWTGIDVRPVDTQIARYFGLKQAQGVIVSDVQKNSPADRAGILIADIIVEINGERIITTDNMMSIMQESRAGDTWKVKVYRDKKIVTIELLLEKQS
ncbi:MAG: trypsin-like peptidase domain-containing protein [Bacteroidetes bacterium]|nr:trypsin-like peptidase domain-containing protein [Bacteroidota bacterium]